MNLTADMFTLLHQELKPYLIGFYSSRNYSRSRTTGSIRAGRTPS